MYFLFKDDGISIKLIENIAGMINEEIKLLKGLLKSDKEKYKRIIESN